MKIYAMENDPQILLDKVAKDFPNAKHAYQKPGVNAELPVFYEKLKNRLIFPFSWLSGNFTNFDEWRNSARSELPPHNGD